MCAARNDSKPHERILTITCNATVVGLSIFSFIRIYDSTELFPVPWIPYDLCLDNTMLMLGTSHAYGDVFLHDFFMIPEQSGKIFLSFPVFGGNDYSGGFLIKSMYDSGSSVG